MLCSLTCPARAKSERESWAVAPSRAAALCLYHTGQGSEPGRFLPL